MNVTDEMVEAAYRAADASPCDNAGGACTDQSCNSFTCKEGIRSALAAALAAAPKPRVKALKWREWHGAHYGSAPYMMDYEIRQRGEVFKLRGADNGRDFMSVDEAKAAAQADYERRILAALEDQS